MASSAATFDSSTNTVQCGLNTFSYTPLSVATSSVDLTLQVLYDDFVIDNPEDVKGTQVCWVTHENMTALIPLPLIPPLPPSLHFFLSPSLPPSLSYSPTPPLSLSSPSRPPLPSSVTVYDCNFLGSNCAQCLSLDAKYSCNYCSQQERTPGDCTFHSGEDASPLCPDRIELNVFRQCDSPRIIDVSYLSLSPSLLPSPLSQLAKSNCVFSRGDPFPSILEHTISLTLLSSTPKPHFIHNPPFPCTVHS